MSSYLMRYSVLYELNTLDACWISVDVWSNSSRCRQESIYLTRTWCLYFIIIALDIVITLRFSINCSTVICSPTVIFSILREVSSETYGPRVYFPSYKFPIYYFPSYKFPIYYFAIFYFQIYKPKNPKIFYLLFSFIYLSLSDLTFASDREGIDNPFIALGASVWLFVQVHLLGTCVFLLLDWYLGS